MDEKTLYTPIPEGGAETEACLPKDDVSLRQIIEVQRSRLRAAKVLLVVSAAVYVISAVGLYAYNCNISKQIQNFRMDPIHGKSQ